MKKILIFVLAFMLLPSIADAAWIDRTDAGGIVTASADYPPNEAAAMAFDNRLDTKWLAFVDAVWIQFDFDPIGDPNAAYAITKYAITSGNDAPERDPKDWTFEGSDDGISWDVLDTRSGESWANRIETREFSVANTTAYKIYRLNITANQTSPGLTQVTEIALLEDDGTLEPWINRTEEGGSASASGENPPNETAAKAFDGLVSTKWLVFADSGWIQFQFTDNTGYAISKYAITSANDAPERDPKDWELQGSYDGVLFFTIDSQTNQSWTYRFETKEYQIANNYAFPIYRLNVLANQTPVGLIQIAEITLYEAVRAKAANPIPVNVSVGIETDQILSWDTADEPNDPGVPIANIVSHELYMSGPDPYDDPNLYFVASIPAGSPVEASASYPESSGDWLQRDGLYAWRIDEVLDDASVIVGDVWGFATVLSVPVIDSSLLEDLVREEGESASFTVTAINPFTGDDTGMDYQWYQGLPGDTSTPRGTGQTLVIDPVVATDEGYYYCRVTVIASGGWSDSDTGTLAVPRLIGHWPFDGDAVDIVSGNDGALNGSPLFVKGSNVLVGSGAVQFNSDDDNIALPTAAHLGKAWTFAWWENADPHNLPEGDWESMLACGPTTGYEIFEFNRFNITRYAHGVTGDYIETSLTNPYERGLWYHHAVTYDPETGDTVWYLNGVSTVTWNSGPFDGFDSVMFVGNVREGSQPYRGIIDDLMFYNYPLNAYEVAEVYTIVSDTEICVEAPAADLTGDCAVNMDDLIKLALEWLVCGRYPANSCL